MLWKSGNQAFWSKICALHLVFWKISEKAFSEELRLLQHQSGTPPNRTQDWDDFKVHLHIKEDVTISLAVECKCSGP